MQLKLHAPSPQCEALWTSKVAEARHVEKRNSCGEFLTQNLNSWCAFLPSHPFRHRIALIVEMGDAHHIGGAR